MTSQEIVNAPGAPVDTEPRYTIQDAADYLGVSQPTIFRWMKRGTISFYKVGGSTRFSKAGLDAVIEKNTGSKEAEAATGRCAACGHTELVEGCLQGTGQLYFKPFKTRFWVLADSMVGLRAKVCTACGYIQLHADVDKPGKIRPEAVQEEAGTAGVDNRKERGSDEG